MQGDTAAVTWCCTQSYTDCDVRSTVTLPTLVHKQQSTDILWDVHRKYTPQNWISELYTNERALIWLQQEFF